MQFAPRITLNPENQDARVGTTATFTAAAVGNPTLTVQWQVSADGGKTWTKITGATSTTLTLIVNAGQSGSMFRAVFSNALGTAASAAATLTAET